jgi:HrpA-like RNA helicase
MRSKRGILTGCWLTQQESSCIALHECLSYAVINSGYHKEMRYDHNRGMSCLEDSWISKANARQRRGHAGRVHPGCCLRLFNRQQFQKLDEQQLPEMLWVSLEGLCLEVSHLPTCGVPFSQFPLPLILL